MSASARPHEVRFGAIGAVLFVNLAGIGAVYALLGDLREIHGLSKSSVGLIGGVTFFVSVLTQLGLARFADRGLAALMLRGGIVVIAAGLVWFAFATKLWEFVLARTVMGFGSGLFMPASRRIVVRAEPARAGELLGRLGSIEVAGFVIGPPVAGVVADHTSLRVPFLVPAAVLLGALVLFRHIPAVGSDGHGERRGVRALLALPAVRAVLFVGAGVNLTFGIFEATMSVFLKDLGSSQTAIGIVLAAFAVPYVFLSTLGGRLADRANPLRIALLGLALSIPTVLGFGLATSALFVGMVGFVRSSFDAITVPACAVAVARSGPDELVATGQGLLNATYAFVGGVAAMVGAVVYDAGGKHALWGGTAAVVALLAVAGWLTARRHDLLGVAGPVPAVGAGAAGTR